METTNLTTQFKKSHLEKPKKQPKSASKESKKQALTFKNTRKNYRPDQKNLNLMSLNSLVSQKSSITETLEEPRQLQQGQQKTDLVRSFPTIQSLAGIPQGIINVKRKKETVLLWIKDARSL